jgi:hypothetical protein
MPWEKAWVLAWALPNGDVKKYDVESFEAGMARLERMAEPRTEKKGKRIVTVWPDISWSAVVRNTEPNRRALGV